MFRDEEFGFGHCDDSRCKCECHVSVGYLCNCLDCLCFSHNGDPGEIEKAGET